MPTSPDNSVNKQPNHVQWVIAAPFLVVIAILIWSPNFQTPNGGSAPARTDPLGSDFLQEWTGGYIVLSADRDRLYQREHFIPLEHDANLLGFQWPEKDYYPMVYPPFYYLLTSPFASLPYTTAMRIWMLMLGACISGYFWLMLRYFPLTGTSRSRMVAILLGSLLFTPLLTSLTMAQKSVLLLLILSATFLLLRNRRPLSAGIIFGLIAFKPHLGLPIGIAMLLKKQWCFVAGSTISVGCMVTVCFLTSPRLCVDYFNQCIGQGDYTSNGGYQLTEAQSLHAVCHLALDAVSPKLALFAAGILTLCVVILLQRILRGPLSTTSQLFGMQFASLVVATVLVSPHFYQYDLTILLLPMMIVWSLLSGNWPDSLNVFVSQTHRRWLLGTTLAIFFGASQFAPIAGATHIQLSTIILLSLLITIWLARRNNLESAEKSVVDRPNADSTTPQQQNKSDTAADSASLVLNT